MEVLNYLKKYIFILVLFFVIIILPFSCIKAKELTNVYEIYPIEKCVIKRNVKNNIRSMQGVYFYDNYAIYSGHESDSKPNVLTLVDMENCTVLDINKEKVMGHANDITYDSKNNKFYVTSGDYDHLAYGFEIKDNKIVVDTEPRDIGLRLAAFAYDKDRDRFIGYANGKFYLLSKINAGRGSLQLLNEIKVMYDNVKFITQGIAYANNNIYFARAIEDDSSYILVYSAITGEYKYAMHVSKDYYKGHLEGITIIDNNMYLGFNKYGSNAKQMFLELKNVNKYEEAYNNKISERERIFNNVKNRHNEDALLKIRVIVLTTIVILIVLFRTKIVIKNL